MAVTILSAWAGPRSPLLLPLLGLTLCAHLSLVLADVRWGLGLFVIVAGLSPDLPGAHANLRVEDLLFALIIPAWFLQQAKLGRRPMVQPSFIRCVALPYLVLWVISFCLTLRGSALGLGVEPLDAWLIQAKRLEYLLVAVVVATTVGDPVWRKRLSLCLVLGGGLTALFSLTHPGDWTVAPALAEKRVFGPPGENYNTLSAYLIVCAGVGLTILATVKDALVRGGICACVGLSILAVLFSYSREGLILLLCLLAILALLPGRFPVLGALLGVLVILMLVPSVQENLAHTVRLIQSSTTDDPVRNSLTARFHGWNYRWEGWVLEQPLFGSGVGSVPLSVDSEYLLRVCEGGMLGLVCLLGWLYGLGRYLLGQVRSGPRPNALAWGLLAILIVLTIQAAVAPAFTNVRPMEPFWFALGLLAASQTSGFNHKERKAS